MERSPIPALSFRLCRAEVIVMPLQQKRTIPLVADGQTEIPAISSLLSTSPDCVKPDRVKPSPLGSVKLKLNLRTNPLTGPLTHNRLGFSILEGMRPSQYK